MCLSIEFFSVLLFYFSLLLFSTVMRRFVTYRGLFYTFTTFLIILLVYLMANFTPILLFNKISEFSLAMNWVNWLALDVTISLKLDALSYLFVLLVVAIGLATNFYTLNYLKYEAHEDIFSILINWFMFSMIILVLANNLFTLFLGWESIGLTSFFLINFWNTRRGTVKSSFKAFCFNKISDVFLFIFLVLIHYTTFLNDLTQINMQLMLNFIPINHAYELSIGCLFLCTLFKSAQLFGHLWLPDSMEAPVPASALIHSATLVSAGIYLLMRFTPLVTLNQLQTLIIIVGSITAAYGGIVSASQTDMKKLLAYSTISHCGFLFVTIGTEFYAASIIYLFLHGLFKASTFFCAGSFIRVAGSQDTRNMGGLNRILPVDTVFLIICSFNLGGLPFSLGYLYKSIFIGAILNSKVGFLALGFCMVGLLCSLVYVYRLVYYSAFDVSKEFFPLFIYELQQKQVNVVKHWSLTSIVQIVAVFIILLFTLWVYVYFTNYFLNSDLILDHAPIILESNVLLSVDSTTFYKHFYELFYTLYIIVFITISVISWRVEYSYGFKLNSLLFLTLTVFSLTVWSTIL